MSLVRFFPDKPVQDQRTYECSRCRLSARAST